MKEKIPKLARCFLLILISCLPLLLIAKLFFLKDPPVWPDEPLFFDLARNFLKTGKMTTSLYGGIFPDLEAVRFGYQPLYFYLLAGWMKLFGISIEVMRSFSLTLAIASLAVFFLTIKTYFKNSNWAIFGTLLLACNIFLLRASRLGRMEILTLFFLMASFLFFRWSLREGKSYLYPPAGLLAGLASLSHPIGAIALLNLFLGTILDSKRKHLLKQLSLAFLPVLVLYIVWMLITQDNLYSLFVTYLAHFHDKAPKPPFAWVLFQSDFSWRILFFLQIAVTAILTFFLVRFPRRDYLTAVGALLFSSLVVLLGKEGGYLLYPQPFFVLGLLLVVKFLSEAKNEMGIFLAFFLSAAIFLAQLNIQFFNNDNLGITNQQARSYWDSQSYDYHRLTSRIIGFLSKEEPDVFTALPRKTVGVFITATPDPYFDLEKFSQLKLYETADPYFPINETAYKRVLDSTSYIILTWIPHQFLADYIYKNTEKAVKVGQAGEYSAVIIKLKPLAKRT